mmetsp:Transcript_63068/g.133136  ORF Transcript_63068/g.133136 Transcript_63068/m.133136 type:complete len:305 (+) Transcript_63068:29-943(+)
MLIWTPSCFSIGLHGHSHTLGTMVSGTLWIIQSVVAHIVPVKTGQSTLGKVHDRTPRIRGEAFGLLHTFIIKSYRCETTWNVAVPTAAASSASLEIYAFPVDEGEAHLRVGVAEKIHDLGSVSPIPRGTGQIFVSKVEVALAPAWVVSEDGHIVGSALLYSFEEEFLGCLLDDRHSMIQLVDATANLLQLASTLVWTIATKSPKIGFVPIQDEQFEIEFRDLVEVSVVRHLEVLSGITIHAALVGVELIAVVSLSAGAVGVGSTASGRVDVGLVASEPRFLPRAGGTGVAVPIVVVPHHCEPRH